MKTAGPVRGWPGAAARRRAECPQLRAFESMIGVRGPRATPCARHRALALVTQLIHRGNRGGGAHHQRSGQHRVPRRSGVGTGVQRVVAATAFLQAAAAAIQRVVLERTRGMLRLLRAAHEAAHEAVEGVRRMVRRGRECLGGRTDKKLAARVRGGKQNRVGRQRRVIQRRRHARLDIEEVLGVHGQRRFQSGRLDQRHADRRLLLLQFQPQRIGEALDRVLRGRVGALQRQRSVRRLAAHVDDGAAVLAQVRGSRQRAMHGAPVVGIEQPPLVFQRHVAMAAEDGHAGVVDPGIEATEALDGSLRHLANLFMLADIGHHGDDFIAMLAQLFGQLVQRALAARHQHQPCTLLRRLARRHQAHAAAGTGQDDDLRANVLQGWFHRRFLLGEARHGAGHAAGESQGAFLSGAAPGGGATAGGPPQIYNTR
ncbi:hypothetical protein CNECB9_290001 [Cupriavidus necator]|uniref:Uncharacterized protein n=1 Tax=Cupriavidus necator TaxID=106590 RepID=A0A1K0IH19_CUPNE|nr:hypothetical protein CNECB9_290001 [Cupriavidus necator]